MTTPTPDQINAAIAVEVFGWVECEKACYPHLYKGAHWHPSKGAAIGTTAPPDFHGDSAESDRLVDAMVAQGWGLTCGTCTKGYWAHWCYLAENRWTDDTIAETRPAAVAEAVYRALGLGE